ncbi:MAG TPA: ABC transporter permease, partial [Chitinophagaceae bacterium]|nr:ABC transporter permease [Chitinophagaceae bacterium]
MFKNYLKTAWRNLTRHKGFTLINVLGLTIGLTGCLVIGIFVWDELQFDKGIPGAQNIYRVYDKWDRRGATSFAAPVPPAYTTYMQQNYPEVDTTARIYVAPDKFLVEANEKSNYEERGWFVDASFFQVFPIKFIHGDPNTALTDPNGIVISEDMANRYFGKENPIGKTLKIDKGDLTVRGVMGKLPTHFHLDFNYLMALPAAGIEKERMEAWGWNQFYTYVKLKPGANVKAMEKKFQDHVRQKLEAEQSELITIPYFQPLKDIHLNSSELVYDIAIRGNASYVKALTVIALFVLAIACFNFINLATARSFRRAKEIGVRKVVGADRKQLVFQFIGETILLAIISVVIATIATVFVTPLLNQFTGKSIEFNPVTNPLLGLLILAGGVAIGILAGIYPALILSGFQPIRVLKSMKLSASGGSHIPVLRQALVVVQFALSALLIVSAIIVFKQTNYLNSKDLGFNKEQ